MPFKKMISYGQFSWTASWVVLITVVDWCWRQHMSRQLGKSIVSCVARTSPVMVLTMHYRQVLAFYENGSTLHDDVIKWKHFPRYWPFVRGILRSPVNSLHKGQWRGALIFSSICVWINSWVNNRDAGDLRRYCAHYDVSVMICSVPGPEINSARQVLTHWGWVIYASYNYATI